MASSQQMKASSSSHQRQMRPDEKAEHNCMDLGSDSVQLLLCSKILRTPGKYFKFQRLHVVPLLLFTIKSSLPGAETSFIYMFSSSSFSVSASVPVSQPNLFHRALTQNPKSWIWWQPPCSTSSTGQQEQLLPASLQKDVLPNSVPPLPSFAVFKTLLSSVVRLSKLLGDTLHLYASSVLE